MSTLTLDELVAAAARERESFAAHVKGLPYERKGVLFSEMFFFYLCARSVAPRRILESGRARGQSTLILAITFPELPIISFEHDPDSPDVPVAAERLRGRGKVELRFGDATRELPRLAQAGDVALIDGPKGWRGLRFALRLLAQGRVEMVFVHDVLPACPERRFLQKWLPAALYSDDPRFAALAHPLDAPVEQQLPQERRWRPGGPAAGYGYSLACLPRTSRGRAGLAWVAAVFAGLGQRAGAE